jgi:hypothetical protein
MAGTVFHPSLRAAMARDDVLLVIDQERDVESKRLDA